MTVEVRFEKTRMGLGLAAGLFAATFAAAQSGSGASIVSASENWGSAPGHTTLMGFDLSPIDGGNIFREFGAAYCGAVQDRPDQQAGAHLNLPDGATLTQLEFWAYDVHPTEWLTFEVLETCQTPGSGISTTTSLGSAETFGAIGTYYGATPLLGHTVDNPACGYSVRVRFSQPETDCVGASLQVQKIRVSFVRQVSPAPASATFNDVPTGHPYFQFVEALARSGITGGCGAGFFCPDQTLTRGQMAVFLAKGLGLSWP